MSQSMGWRRRWRKVWSKQSDCIIFSCAVLGGINFSVFRLPVSFLQVGHHDLVVLTSTCSGMSWKTSASKHLSAFVNLFPILVELLHLCYNGLAPDAMLQKATFFILRVCIFCVGTSLVGAFFGLGSGHHGLSRKRALHGWTVTSWNSGFLFQPEVADAMFQNSYVADFN